MMGMVVTMRSVGVEELAQRHRRSMAMMRMRVMMGVMLGVMANVHRINTFKNIIIEADGDWGQFLNTCV